MQQNYPSHIYEPIRQELAKSYIRHELSKYLPSATGEWKKDIDKWFEGSSVGLFPVRDFWNGFYGILMGFKLYIHLIEFVTGENVVWSREDIEIEGLTFTDFGEYEPHHTGDEPVIITQKQIDGEDKLVVYDGNNRVNQAKKRGDKNVKAFVGRFADERRTPVNFWLATPIIYEIYSRAKKAGENEDLYRAYLKVLANILSQSESGKYEFINRVPGKEDGFKKKLLADLNL
ncbi:hypothetical protein HYS10_01415 [Candidatus Collierbacteria bacterium]|nr:hypothetical protein [Candidatus Collierbacteria bacterium]